MDNLYLNVEDGNIIWYQTGHKGGPEGGKPQPPTIGELTEYTI